MVEYQAMVRRFCLVLALLAPLGAGCASVSTYTKPDAPWAAVKRVGIFPFTTPFEDSVRRQWATALFVKELQRLEWFEAAELADPAPSPKAPDYSALARTAGVDAYFLGTVEDMAELFADLKLVDAATGETLWSTRYHRGAGLELSIRYHTPQQQLQRIYRVLLRRLAKANRPD